MRDINFIKMHGLGNDFVVFDARTASIEFDDQMVRAIANRHTGVGCDQLVILEPARSPEADLFMRIHNADGSEVVACGNATRCVAAKVMDDNASDQATIETRAGLLTIKRTGTGFTVNMGKAFDDWKDIPLAWNADTLHLELSEGVLSDPVGVNIGNPHLVFFVDKLANVPLANLGPKFEHNPLFPEGTNVEVVQVISYDRLKIRVWERGVGITQACGTGACAALVASHRRGFTGRQAQVELEGGSLEIVWQEDNKVLMTGPASISFTGTWHL